MYFFLNKQRSICQKTYEGLCIFFGIKMFIIYIDENAFLLFLNKSNEKLFKEKMVSYIMGHFVNSFLHVIL